MNEKMRMIIIDERGILRNGKKIILKREIKQINLPEEFLERFKEVLEKRKARKQEAQNEK